MIAELIKSFRGVYCSRCREPIAASPKVVSIQDEVQQRETNAPFSFSMRCKLCEYESVYVISDLRLFDGEPRKRAFKATAGKYLRFTWPYHVVVDG